MLIELWKRKFGMEVRDISIADINDDGLDELIIASWDAKIHAISSSKVLWATREQEYPAENVEIIRDGLGRPQYIVGSFHRKIVAFNLNGQKQWEQKVKSWVYSLISIGAGLVGYSTLVGVDIKGNLFVVSGSGEILNYHESKVLARPNVIFPMDNYALVGTKNGELLVVDNYGELVEVREVGAESILSVSSYTFRNLSRLYIVGREKDVLVLNDEFSLIQKIRLKDQENFYLVAACDALYDDKPILVVGSWSTNKVNFLQYDPEKERFLVKKQIVLEGNPLNFACADLNGNLEKEIIISDDLGYTYVYDYLGKNELSFIESKNSIYGVVLANTQGFGRKDIIIRTAKEEIGAYAFVPRVHYLLDEDKDSGKLLVFVPSGVRINSDNVIELDNANKKYFRRTYKKKTYGLYEIPFKIAFKGRVSKLKLTGKGKGMTAKILLPSNKALDAFTEVITLANNDILLISKDLASTREDLKIANLRIKGMHIKENVIEIDSEFYGNDIFIAELPLDLNQRKQKSKQTRKRSYVFYVVPEKVVEVAVDLPQVVLSDNALIIKLKNNSRKKLQFEITSAKTKIFRATGTLPPNEKITINLKPNLITDELRVDIKDILQIKYGKEGVGIGIPIKTTILNVPKIKQRYEKLVSLTKDKALAISTLAKEAGIDESTIRKILGDLK